MHVELTPADALDRLLVANVKASRVSPERRLQAQHTREYWYSACRRLLQIDLPQLQRLGEIHAQLWDVEDRIRRLDGHIQWHDDNQPRMFERLSPELEQAMAMYMQAARQVYLLNDERSRLKREIDEQLGSTPEIKEYVPYDNQPNASQPPG